MMLTLYAKFQNLYAYLLSLIFILSMVSCAQDSGDYICTPCNLPCDKLSFEKPGICPHCNMALIKRSDYIDITSLVPNLVDLKEGSGVFLVSGRKGREDQVIPVYYHVPLGFSKESKVLMVIPGAGRNADSYRDVWNEESELYNVLILCPEFNDQDYPFQEYHLGGLIKDVNLSEAVVFAENSNQAYLDEDKLSFRLNDNREDWIFADLERIFELVVSSGASKQTGYDLFGHSAGAQILHRMALFANNSKANQLIAANSGFYTMPDYKLNLPFGLANTIIHESDLKRSFAKDLKVIVGVMDNQDEGGGTLLRSPTVDQQGTHRLARAQYFFAFSKAIAKQLNTPFNWELEFVPKVGHDHELMGNTAAKILYETAN